MFEYVVQALQKVGRTMETPEIMENVNVFVILVGERGGGDG